MRSTLRAWARPMAIPDRLTYSEIVSAVVFFLQRTYFGFDQLPLGRQMDEAKRLLDQWLEQCWHNLGPVNGKCPTCGCGPYDGPDEAPAFTHSDEEV